MNTHPIRLLVATAVLTLASWRAGDQYTFTRVADNSGSFGAFEKPQINNSGVVAFRAAHSTVFIQ